MPAHERLTAAIVAANEANRPALVPFITAGYPEPGEFINTLKSIATVGDVVEIGIPFSDPMADGMTIQRSSFAALREGVNLEWIFSELEMAGVLGTPLVMMSYLNPLLAYGYEHLAERARATGVCAFIVPDLPYEECAELREALENEGLGLIQLVTPATPEDRLAMLCDASRGFVYAVTITGVTGGDAGLPADPAGLSRHGVARVEHSGLCRLRHSGGKRRGERRRACRRCDRRFGARRGSRRGPRPEGFSAISWRQMKKLTSAPNLVTINHYKNVLESEGIPCMIKNEHLGAVLGEIPFLEVWPELWVVNDLDVDRAKQLLDTTIVDESPAASWRCEKCGEQNEGQFAACWNCGEEHVE